MSVAADVRAFLRSPHAFAASLAPEQAELWTEGLALAQSLPRSLRPAQLAAWQGMAAHRTALVLGPPGTGKTFLLAGMAAGFLRACVQKERPCRVLLTGFTRESIGNLFEGLAPLLAQHLSAVKMVFLGNPPDQPLPGGVEQEQLRGERGIADGRQVLKERFLVAGATAWSLFKMFEEGAGPAGDGPTARVFELVLIDEASQMLVGQGLLCLSGLAEGGRVIVAGDDRQLPPVRQGHPNTGAEGRLLGGSLYAFLKSGQAVEFRLDETFRLNGPLAEPVARQFYNSAYSSAESVKNRRLALRTEWEAGLSDWQRLALDPELPLCVLLHDGPPSATDNPFERCLLRELAQLFAERMPGTPDALWRERLAIVTPHRAQNVALREELSEDAVVETVDRIQGRERDVILAGYTVSDPEFALIEAPFLFDARRLNVTVTRARSKLVLLVSRRLLEVLPADEEVFESATQLREYIFSCDEIARTQVPGPDGQTYAVEIRGQMFPTPAPSPVTPPEPTMPPPLTPAQEKLLQAIGEAVEANNGFPVWAAKIAAKLGRYPGPAELRELYWTGRVVMVPGVNNANSYTKWKPRHESILVYPNDFDSVRGHLAEVFAAVKKPELPTALYTKVREHFLWFDDDGNDQFLPLLQQLVKEGICRLEKSKDQKYDLIRMLDPSGEGATPKNEPPVEEGEDPPEDDFRLLNELEAQELKEINFGAYETSHSVDQIAQLAGWPAAEAAPMIGRLVQHRYLVCVAEGKYRSRMAEMARLVRYLKQRFGPEDAGKRPFLARSIQLRVLGREKPARNQKLAPVLSRLKEALADVPGVGPALDGLAAMLVAVWGKPEVEMAAFQLRPLEALLPAYLGRGEDDTFAITADTGSGKTEAGILPLMAGAVIDRFAGKRGVKAMLVYPRIRLAYNQAERLVRYLAALARMGAGLQLTVGLQTREVVNNFPPYNDELWTWNAAEQAYDFPLFRCPVCLHDLLLRPEQGHEGADRLECPSCRWRFAGWIGTKQKLRASPPDFFLPVTESLHQWQHDPRNGALFGDDLDFCAPRALLADEVHLYSHIHGMQVGYALQHERTPRRDANTSTSFSRRSSRAARQLPVKAPPSRR